MIFLKINQIVTSVISRFRVILTREFNFNIMLMIQDHFQGQKVNFKVKIAKIQVGNTSRNNCNRAYVISM